jgi:hypothetical protein
MVRAVAEEALKAIALRGFGRWIATRASQGTQPPRWPQAVRPAHN